MRPLVLLGIVLCVCGCKSVCTMAVTCPPIDAKFDLAFSCKAQPLESARFELCRTDGCKSSSIARRGGTSTSDPRAEIGCTSLACRCTEEGALEVSVSGIGPMSARVFVRDANGEERIAVERNAEVIWEEYEFEGGCAGDKDCTHYALR